MNGTYAQGEWSVQERTRHINWLDLQAVWNCLQEFQNQVAGKRVLLRSDNMTVVQYLNKQGGTKSATLCFLTWKVLLWCQEHRVEIRAVHIAGLDNGLADYLSRERVKPTEWSLNEGVVKRLFSILGRPHVDLFAHKNNAKLPTYCSVPPGFPE